jgi:hypothetical protein
MQKQSDPKPLNPTLIRMQKQSDPKPLNPTLIRMQKQSDAVNHVVYDVFPKHIADQLIAGKKVDPEQKSIPSPTCCQICCRLLRHDLVVRYAVGFSKF